MSFFSKDYPSKPSGDLVQCSKCGRGFAKERIEKHVQICNSTKERQIYDIAKARIIGTEAEELYKAGKIQIKSTFIRLYYIAVFWIIDR